MATLGEVTYLWRLTANKSYVYGLNILVIILASISVLWALHGIIQTPFFRSYLTVLFSALSLTLYPIITIIGSHNEREDQYHVAGLFLEGLSTLPLWWLLFIMMRHISSPRLAHDPEKMYRQYETLVRIQCWYSIFATVVYGGLMVLGASGLQLDFIIIIYGVQYVVWMYKKPLDLYNDVHSLGFGFRAFVGILIYHFIANLLSIIFFFTASDYFIDMEEYPWFGLLPFVMNGLPVCVGLILVLVAFPRFWVPRIQQVQTQYGGTEPSAEAEPVHSSDHQQQLQDNTTSRMTADTAERNKHKRFKQNSISPPGPLSTASVSSASYPLIS